MISLEEKALLREYFASLDRLSIRLTTTWAAIRKFVETEGLLDDD